jgi:hypothetical protein
MRMFRLVSMLLVVVLLLVGILWIGNQISGLNPFATKETTRTGPTVIQSVRNLSDLATIEAVEYTTVEKGRDAGILNFARGDRIFLFAVAKVGAGIDLSQLNDDAITVDQAKKSVRIRLPDPKILYVALDNNATQVYNRDTGIFTRGDLNLEAQARQAAEALLREQALKSGILDKATENAKRALTAFLKGLGFDEITILGAHQEEPPKTG